jgi:polyhydroxybutyrate depolymerase
MSVSRRRPWRSLAAAVVTLGLIGAVPACRASGPGGVPREEVVRVAHGGVERTSLVYTPRGHAADRPMPLVLVFHGGFGSGARVAGRLGINEIAEREGFIAVYPDGIEAHWNDGRSTTAHGADDVGFVRALVEHLRAVRPVDEARIYATGLSNGGYFTQRLACETADEFAAFAPVMSSLPVTLRDRCDPGRPVPMLLIAGTDDPLVPWSGGALSQARRLGGYGGEVTSVAEALEFWRVHAGCAGPPEVEELEDRDPDDGTRVRRSRYADCDAGTEVLLLGIQGGGHTWPGAAERARVRRLVGPTSRDIDASEVIWEFFAAHRLGSDAPEESAAGSPPARP